MKIIKTLRENAGYSQDELAKAVGVSRQTIIKYENGDSVPTLENIRVLAKVFDVDCKCFIDDELPAEPNYNIVKERVNNDVSADMRIDIPQNNIDKFKQVFLYILKKIGAKPNVGQTVIYKLLYFIDFDYYELFEEQLMGLTYIKNNYGPTPVDFARIIQEMKDAGQIDEVKSKYYNHEMTKYLPIVEPDLSILNGQEIKHIDWVLNRLSDKNANELSALSHKDVPWMGAEDKKPLEYEAVFYRTPETSVREYAEN